MAEENIRTFSIFGDSISTLQGYNPPRYDVEYRGINRDRAEVFEMADTWWGMVIDHFGGRMLANNSYSGSMVTRFLTKLFPAGCSDERMDALAEAGEPDVLLVELGMNDWNREKPVEEPEEGLEWCDAFEPSYTRMLEGLRARFPRAEIWCLGLMYSKRLLKMYGPADIAGMEVYDAAIARCAGRFGARMIDLYHTASPYSSWDLAHPDREGMRTIADAVIRAMEAAQ